jgi:hypothetical protein
MKRARNWLSMIAWGFSNSMALIAIQLDPEHENFDREGERARSAMLRAIDDHRREMQRKPTSPGGYGLN